MLSSLDYEDKQMKVYDGLVIQIQFVKQTLHYSGNTYIHTVVIHFTIYVGLCSVTIYSGLLTDLKSFSTALQT